MGEQSEQVTVKICRCDDPHPYDERAAIHGTIYNSRWCQKCGGYLGTFGYDHQRFPQAWGGVVKTCQKG